MNTIGIDPGLTGAWAAVRGEELLALGDMPTLDGRVSAILLYNALAQWKPERVIVEEPHAMPKNGSQANFKLGRSLGTVAGACMFWRTEFVTPAKWKADMGVQKKKGMTPSEAKDVSRLRAIELWPDFAEDLARKKDADRAEAALIALWAGQ